MSNATAAFAAAAAAPDGEMLIKNSHPKKKSKKRKRSGAAAASTLTTKHTKLTKNEAKQRNNIFSNFVFGPAAFRPLATLGEGTGAAVSTQVTLDVGGGRLYVVDVKARTQTNCSTGFVRRCQRIAAGGQCDSYLGYL